MAGLLIRHRPACRVLANLYNGNVYIWNYLDQARPGSGEGRGTRTDVQQNLCATRTNTQWPGHRSFKDTRYAGVV